MAVECLVPAILSFICGVIFTFFALWLYILLARCCCHSDNSVASVGIAPPDKDKDVDQEAWPSFHDRENGRPNGKLTVNTQPKGTTPRVKITHSDSWVTALKPMGSANFAKSSRSTSRTDYVHFDNSRGLDNSRVLDNSRGRKGSKEGLDNSQQGAIMFESRESNNSPAKSADPTVLTIRSPRNHNKLTVPNSKNSSNNSSRSHTPKGTSTILEGPLSSSSPLVPETPSVPEFHKSGNSSPRHSQEAKQPGPDAQGSPRHSVLSAFGEATKIPISENSTNGDGNKSSASTDSKPRRLREGISNSITVTPPDKQRNLSRSNANEGKKMGESSVALPIVEQLDDTWSLVPTESKQLQEKPSLTDMMILNPNALPDGVSPSIHTPEDGIVMVQPAGLPGFQPAASPREPGREPAPTGRTSMAGADPDGESESWARLPPMRPQDHDAQDGSFVSDMSMSSIRDSMASGGRTLSDQNCSPIDAGNIGLSPTLARRSSSEPEAPVRSSKGRRTSQGRGSLPADPTAEPSPTRMSPELKPSPQPDPASPLGSGLALL
eukprot:g34792.t1